MKMKSDSGAFTNVLDRLARLASERPEVNLKVFILFCVCFWTVV